MADSDHTRTDTLCDRYMLHTSGTCAAAAGRHVDDCGPVDMKNAKFCPGQSASLPRRCWWVTAGPVFCGYRHFSLFNLSLFTAMQSAADIEDALKLAKQAAREAGALIRAAASRQIIVTVKSGVDLVTETDKACEDLITSMIKARFPAHGFVGEGTYYNIGRVAVRAVTRRPSPTCSAGVTRCASVCGTVVAVVVLLRDDICSRCCSGKSGLGAWDRHGAPHTRSPLIGLPPVRPSVAWRVRVALQEVPDGPTWFVDPLDGTTNFVHGYPFVAVSIALVMNRVPVMGVIYNPIMDEMYYASAGKVRRARAPSGGHPLQISPMKHQSFMFVYG